MAFTEADLQVLEEFITNESNGVVKYIDVVRQWAQPGSIAMRHDVDHSIDKAVEFAKWEHWHGYQSTYFLLHSADYWDGSDRFYNQIRLLHEMDHEVGLHNDALCAVDGDMVAAAELIRSRRNELVSIIGDDHVRGIADHGGSPHANGEIWTQYTPEYFGFEYEAYQLQRGTNTFISDNRGQWRSPLVMAQTFMLIHPTWWPV